MTEYRCLVATDAGRVDWRRVEAIDARQAAASLSASGFTPLDIRSGRMGVVERLNQPVRLGGVGLAEQALVMGQLAALVRSGLPVDRSLDLLRDQAPKARLCALLRDMLAAVREGQGLASAIEAQRMFPRYVVGVVRSAERSGQLGSALTSLADRLAQASRTRRQLVTALTYPAAVLVATALALVLVLTVVVPQFAPIFRGQEDRLPALTRMVLALSDAIDRHGVALAGIAVALPVAVVMLARALAGDERYDALRARIPGAALRDQYLAAQFTGLLGLLVANDVKVVGALDLARGAIGSRRWRAQIALATDRVREGQRLSQALQATRFVPRTAIRLIEVGERTGSLASTCRQASEILADAATARIDRVVALANPIAIMTLGGIVALLVGGVILGIFALGDFAG